MSECCLLEVRGQIEKKQKKAGEKKRKKGCKGKEEMEKEWKRKNKKKSEEEHSLDLLPQEKFLVIMLQKNPDFIH